MQNNDTLSVSDVAARSVPYLLVDTKTSSVPKIYGKKTHSGVKNTTEFTKVQSYIYVSGLTATHQLTFFLAGTRLICRMTVLDSQVRKLRRTEQYIG